MTGFFELKRMPREVARLGTLLLGLTVIRNFGALTMGQVIGSGVRFLYLVALARFIGPEGVGTYIYGFAIGLVLLGLAVYGQGTLLSVRLGKSRANLSGLLSHSFTIIVAMTVVATVLGFSFLVLAEREAEAFWPLALFILAVSPRAVVWWVRQCYVALEQTNWIPRYELVFRGGEALAGITALFLGADLLAVCGIHLVAWTLEAAMSLKKLTGHGGVSLTLGRNVRLLTRLFQVSSFFVAALWLLNLHGQIGVLGLGFWLPDAANVAYFGVAAQILSVLLLLPVNLGQASLPIVSRGYRSGGQAPAVLLLVVKVCLVSGGLVAILGDWFGVRLVTMFFGDDFAQAGAVFATLCWALGPYAVTILAVMTLNGIGGRALATTMAAVMTVGQIVVLVVCLPLGALTAAMAALVAATTLGCLLGVLFIHRRLGIEGHGWWLRPAIAVGAAGAVMWSDAVAGGFAPAVAVAVLLLLTWRFRVFQSADFNLFRDRLQASAG